MCRVKTVRSHAQTSGRSVKRGLNILLIIGERDTAPVRLPDLFQSGTEVPNRLTS